MSSNSHKLKKSLLALLTKTSIGDQNSVKTLRDSNPSSINFGGGPIANFHNNELVITFLDLFTQITPTVSRKNVYSGLLSSIRHLATKNSIDYCANLLEALNQTSFTAEDTIEEMKRALQAEVHDYVVFVPILGLEVEDKHKLIVNNVEIFHHESAEIQQLQNLLVDIKKQVFEKYYQKMIGENTYFAKLIIHGDEQFSISKAVKAVENLLNLLVIVMTRPYRNSIPNIPIDPEKTTIDYKFSRQDILRIGKFTIRHIVGENTKIGFSAFNNDHYKMPYRLTPNDQTTFVTLTEMYGTFLNQSSQRLRDKFQSSLGWHRRGIESDSVEQAFICFTISLECLLLDKSERNTFITSGSISQKLRERIAWLIGNDADSRIEVGKRIGNLYGKRSGIVHAGETNISILQLSEIEEIAQATIYCFASKKFGSWKTFMTWLNQKIYSSSTDNTD